MLENLEQPWSVYVQCSCVLILKMHLLTWFTGRIRVKKQVIHSEEDRMWMKPEIKVTLSPDGDGHPSVERIRRLHRYDLMTILPFAVIAPLWLSTLPSPGTANFLMCCFAISNTCYTLFHLEVVTAPRCCEWTAYITAFLLLIYINLMTISHYAYWPLLPLWETDTK